MIIPYHVDVPNDRRPFVNWLMVAAMVFIFALQTAIMIQNAIQIAPEQDGFSFFMEDPNKPGQLEHPGAGEPNQGLSQHDQNEPNQLGHDSKPELTQEQLQEQFLERLEQEAAEKQKKILGPIDNYILHGWNIKGLFGHMWLHGGIFHLIGNLIFLRLFGNAICAKIGNRIYLPLFVLFGLAAAISHLIFIGGPMLGASGAINGIVGMFLVFFPENEVSCLWIWFPLGKRFSLSSYWMIGTWFLFDIYGAISSAGTGGVAYFAHLGGFATGAAIAVVMLKMRWVTMETYERSLLELLNLEKAPETNHGESNEDFWARQIASADTATAEPETIPFGQKPPEPEPIYLEPLVIEEFIRFYCACGKKIKVPGIHAGRSGKCPACSTKFVVPKESQNEPPKQQEVTDLIRFVCACGKKIKMPGIHAGKSGKCPACSAKFIVPQKSQAEPPPQQAATDLIRFACACGKKIKVPAKLAGRTGRCPRCRVEVIIPEKPLA